ncbi:MAG: hypothetical protein RSE02_02400 [Bacteroidales bacterium]
MQKGIMWRATLLNVLLLGMCWRGYAQNIWQESNNFKSIIPVQEYDTLASKGLISNKQKCILTNNAHTTKAQLTTVQEENVQTANERMRRLELYLLEIAQEVAEVAEEGESFNAQMVLEYFEKLLERPLNINKAKRGDLEQLFLLSDFQILSLLTYRDEHGEILSGTELSLLHGFNQKLVDILRGFIVFEDSSGDGGKKSSGNFFKDCYSTLLFKSNRTLGKEKWYMPISQEELDKKPNSRYLGTPYYMQLKYKCEYLGRIEVGFTLENDAGEKLFSPIKLPMGDFFSFHTAFKNLRIGKKRGDKGLIITNLILGDFSVRFGQGLTLWNSFSLMSAANPQGLYKRGATIAPYTSSDENNFFRGVAVSFRKEIASGGKWKDKIESKSKNISLFKEVEVTAVFSYNSVDAGINNNIYTSIVTGGIHNTFGTYKTRHTMYETVAGISAAVRFNKLKFGVNWTTYGYNMENGRRIQEYNKYQMYNGTWGNGSVDFYTIINRCRIFGEVAFDYGGSFAAIAGTLFNIENCEVGILARTYSKSYIAPHANAYTTISSCFNQTGIAVNVIYPFSRLLRLSSNIDFAHYPWPRFNIKEASTILKLFVKLEYTGKKFNGYFRLSDSYSTYKSSNKIGIRGVFGAHLFSNFDVRLRGEFVSSSKIKTEPLGKIEIGEAKKNSVGYAAALDLDYRLLGTKLRIQARGAYFKSLDWDTRLYMYEADLPSSFNSQLLYGSGFRGYVLIQVKPLFWMDIFLKLDATKYIERGGDNEIPAPLPKIKIGLKMKF